MGLPRYQACGQFSHKPIGWIGALSIIGIDLIKLRAKFIATCAPAPCTPPVAHPQAERLNDKFSRAELYINQRNTYYQISAVNMADPVPQWEPWVALLFMF